jgi:hypothetical protein
MAISISGEKRGTDVFASGGYDRDKQLPKPGSKADFADLSALGSPRFLVTVDTEEEFDWTRPFTRQEHDTQHVPHIARFQTLCEKYGVNPAYLVDFPIMSDPKAVDLLADWASNGRAAIGVQLHPWVNPPFVEEVSSFNSYASNLPAELEMEKLSQLHAKIISETGVRPAIYRAGRYGAGARTAEFLKELGIAIDSSVRSNFDYSSQSGPNYSSYPLNPYWMLGGDLLELPVTTVFGGALRKQGRHLFGAAFTSSTTRSLLARTGMLERIALTPEGIPLQKAIEGVDLAIEAGVGILNFSFHSPSLDIGHTPYVRNHADQMAFYDWWEKMFEYLEQRGIRPVSVAEIAALKPHKMHACQQSSDLALARTVSHPLSAPQSGPVAQLVRAGRS